MPTSTDPDKRARQLANLVPGAGAWRPGDAPHLQHGERSRRPQASPEWSPAVSLSIVDLEGRVDSSLRTAQGELQSWAVPSVEAVAILRVACERMDRWVADREAKGSLTGEDLERQAKVAERYHRALEREALTLRGRLSAQVEAMDLARLWAGSPTGSAAAPPEAADGSEHPPAVHTDGDVVGIDTRGVAGGSAAAPGDADG